MDLIASPHLTHNAWLFKSALAPNMAAFNAYLSHGRYAAVTTTNYISCLAHFALWMKQEDLPLPRLMSMRWIVSCATIYQAASARRQFHASTATDVLNGRSSVHCR